MAGILNAQNNIAASFPALDQYGPNTTLLLHGDGTNGAQNNTFLDSSTNNFTITRNGNTTQGTFSPFSQPNGYWSNYFNGSTSAYFTIPYTATTFGTDDFTIECWVYITSFAYGGVILDTRSSATANPFAFGFTTGGILNYYNGTSYYTSSAVSLNQWTHVCISRSSGTIKMFINGVQGYSATDTSNLTGTSTTTAKIGDVIQSSAPLWGYISNYRIVKGTGLYTSNFTPSTLPLTAITNTSLLTCQSNRFIDNSSNAFAVTSGGAPTVQAFKPFSSPTAYYPAVNVGAGYFDGSGDYLQVPNNSAFTLNGDFTIEAWIYPTSSVANASIFAEHSNGIDFGFNPSSNLSYGQNFVNWVLQSSSTVPLNAWSHVAISRQSNSVRLYINGTSVASGTDSATYNSQTTNYIGYSGSTYFPGYISNFRLVKGTAVYTGSTYTVPTAPLTAITNTSLLLSCTNAGIIDSVSQNQLETVGNAQVSTTQSKFGASSMYFSGNGGVVNMTAQQTKSIGSGDFTVEFWMYPTSSGATQGLCCLGNYPGAFAGEFNIYYNVSSNGLIRAQFAYGNAINGVSTIALNTWTHIAVSRSGGTLRLFVNGNFENSVASTDVINTSGFSVGQPYPNLSIEYYTGYIDDFRLTTGVGRYTQNFTPPQNAYPDYGPLTNIPTVDPNFKNTTLLLHGNGTNGAQNNTFLDSSTNNFTITRNGNTTQGTFTPFSQPNGWWSNYFNGSSDYLSAASNAAFAISANTDFTFEAWIYLTAAASSNVIYQTRVNGGLAVGFNSGALFVAHDGVSNVIAYTYTPPTNTWIHIAAVRSGTASSNTVLYINGNQVATGSDNTAYGQGAVYIGYNQAAPGWYFPGYISNLRFVNGSAVYTAGLSGFTPSTLPLTAITNTSLLTSQSNYFKDNSTNAFAITPSGTPTVQNFYPFFPPLDYSTAAIGGSAYFDGSGDYLTAPANAAFQFGTGNLTIECFAYSTTSGTTDTLIQYGNNSVTNYVDISWTVYVSSSNYATFEMSDGASSTYVTLTSNTLWPLNSWVHLAVVRSGNNFTMYQNGVSVATGSTTQSFYTPSTPLLFIGRNHSAGTGDYAGYISNTRVVKGTAVYTSAFTPPTAPLTAITNTSILLNYTNAGIFDNASKNDLETVGNAQISTTQSKFGGSSIYLDGASYAITSPNQPFALGTSDFTVEYWVYFTSTAVNQSAVSFGSGGSTYNQALFGWMGSAGGPWQMYASSNNSSWDIANGVTIIPATVSASQWYHIAVTRSGSTFRTFCNGVQQSTFTSTASIYQGDNRVVLGRYTNPAAYYLSGYLDDVRITIGVSRYNYNFTPPAAQFPNK